jgi:DnaK suppressor protein
MAARQQKKESKMTAPRGKKSSTSTGTGSGKSTKEAPEDRHAALKEILLAKREALIKEIKQQLGQSLTDEQQRRLEAAMDSGDQALVDLDREMGISLQEMRNRERQLIDEALDSLDEGTYGVCAECGGEISEKRLEALPFARLCVACKSKSELMEKIERSEQRQ